MALARAAHVTRSASAFGPHGRRRRRTGVHPKAQLRLTGNHGRIADDAARLEIGETKELTERRVGHLLPCHRGTPGAWRACPQSRASACRSFGRLRAPQGPCLGALKPSRLVPTRSDAEPDAGWCSARRATVDCACKSPRIEISSKRIGDCADAAKRRLGRWLFSLARHVSPNFIQAIVTAAVAVVMPPDPVVLSRASLRVASWRAPLGALRWPGRLRSCSRRDLACSSGSQHRDRSAA